MSENPVPDHGYLVLSRKYRPRTFDEIRCQEAVRETLKRAITAGRVAHAYLFCGQRGIGKTTTARILAKALNCQAGPTISPCNECRSCQEIMTARSLDVIEIDGASNRQIDDIRELRDNIKYSPSTGRFKIYIIDEVHMLTEFAFNALLKTLEEPPRHGKFILATTAPNKVPSTIVSRCQRFDFRRPNVSELVELLSEIAQREDFKVSQSALFAIARHAEGSIRDSETLLDQLHAFCPEGIELRDVEQLLGTVPNELLRRYVDAIRSGSQAEVLNLTAMLTERSHSLTEIIADIAEHFRALLALSLGLPKETLGISPTELPRLENQAQQFTVSQLTQALDTIICYEERGRSTSMPRTLLEVLSLRLATCAGTSAGREASLNSPVPDGFELSRPLGASAHAKRSPLEDPRPSHSTQDTGRAGPRETAYKSDGDKCLLEAESPSQESNVAMRQLWEAALAVLRQDRPLLAGVLDSVELLAGDANCIHISPPLVPMWDDQELAAELKNVEETLSQVAGRQIAVVVRPGRRAARQQDVAERLRAVFDCEEL
ncbi:MAG: DNA polymerase III subunit gamma/tau [candidate division WOR-3 bacterium]